jgi:hypothetical protein
VVAGRESDCSRKRICKIRHHEGYARSCPVPDWTSHSICTTLILLYTRRTRSFTWKIIAITVERSKISVCKRGKICNGISYCLLNEWWPSCHLHKQSLHRSIFDDTFLTGLYCTFDLNFVHSAKHISISNNTPFHSQLHKTFKIGGSINFLSTASRQCHKLMSLIASQGAQ